MSKDRLLQQIEYIPDFEGMQEYPLEMFLFMNPFGDHSCREVQPGVYEHRWTPPNKGAVMDDERLIKLIREGLEKAASLGQVTQETMIMFLLLKQVETLKRIDEALTILIENQDS